MRLIPKDWQEFQHYKDRAPPWIKLHKTLLNNFEFNCLPVASRALAPLLWLLASEYEDGIIDASEEKLCFRLHMNKKELYDALHPLIEAEFFATEQDASAALAPCKQNARLDREEGEKEKEKEKETDIRAIEKEEFEKFWNAYPKRGAANPRKPAFEKFGRLLRSGTDPNHITAGAGVYRAECDRLKITGTDKVCTAVVFLNQERFNDYLAQSKSPEQQAVIDLDMARRGFQWRDGKWTKVEDSGVS